MALSDYTTAPSRRRTQGFGDLEYFAELGNAPSSDEMARLGTKVSGAGLYYNSAMERQANYVRPSGAGNDVQTFQRYEGKQPTFNTAYTGMGVSVPSVQNHEFRHAGAQYMMDNFTREQMVDRWGKEGGQIRDILDYKNEGAVEVFDKPNEPAGSYGTMASTIDVDNFRPEWTDVLQRRMESISADVMGDLGVPPRSQPKVQNPWADKSGEVSAESSMDILRRIGELERGLRENPDNAEMIKRLIGYLEQ